jgi:hypothetical protein
VVGNRISGTRNGIEIAGSLKSAIIKQNFIERIDESAIVMVARAGASELAIDNNVIVDVVGNFRDDARSIAAIRAHSVERLQIAGNTIRNVATKAGFAIYEAAIDVIGCSTVSIRDNTATEIVPLDRRRESVAIQVQPPFSSLQIAANSIRRSAEAPDRSSSPWFGIRIAAPVTPGASAPGFNFAVPIFLVVKGEVFAFDDFRLRVFPAPPEAQVTLTGNHLVAWGNSEIVDVSAGTSCIFTANQCLLQSRSRVPAVVSIAADRTVASNNIIRRQGDEDAMRLKSSAVTVLGNITFGRISLVDPTGSVSALPAKWADLNLVAP